MKLFCLSLCMVFSLSLQAEPVKPNSADMLLLSKALPLTPQMQALQLQLAQQPQNAVLRLQLAQLFIHSARKPGFDDWFHQAQSLLSVLTPASKDNSQYWLLLADIQQQQHQFAAALVTLQPVFQREPANINASLMAARIYLAQHNTAGAQQACGRLWQDLFLFSVCSYEVAGRRGNAAQSYSALKQLHAQQKSLSEALDIWLRGILAEQAEMLHHPEQAIAWLAPVLSQAPVSLWLKWADLSLQQGEAQNVYARLQPLQQQYGLTDGLLLRLALAERATAQGGRYMAELEPRMILRAVRGDTDHAADMMHYFLYVQPDAQAALHWAQLNYASAKEPDDVMLLQRARDAAQQNGEPL
jgi:tetratricopeptide (TPR) repeat protein